MACYGGGAAATDDEVGRQCGTGRLHGQLYSKKAHIGGGGGFAWDLQGYHEIGGIFGHNAVWYF